MIKQLCDNFKWDTEKEKLLTEEFIHMMENTIPYMCQKLKVAFQNRCMLLKQCGQMYCVHTFSILDGSKYRLQKISCTVNIYVHLPFNNLTPVDALSLTPGLQFNLRPRGIVIEIISSPRMHFTSVAGM